MKKERRQNLLLLMIFWIASVVPALGNNSFSKNGFMFEIMKDSCSVIFTGCRIPSNVDYKQPLHIPAAVIHDGKKYEVKIIGVSALEGLTTVQSIVIEEGIRQIGSYAFNRCSNLKSVYIPASVTCVGTGLFGSCYNLKEVVVDPRNEYFDSRDNSNAIIDTEEDKLLVACSATRIPSSVKSINESAFYRCNTMEELIIPEGVEVIDDQAFGGCSSLRRITLPQSLREIGSDAFKGCNSLRSIFIPKNVSSIGEINIFNGCNNLSSIVVDEANPVYDSRSGCNAIVRKPDSVLIATCRTTKIDKDIRKLGLECFAGTIIHSINIPKSVVEFPADAFVYCYEIDSLTVEAGNPSYISPEGSNAILTKDGKTLVLGCRTTVIPEGVKEIGECAFAHRCSQHILRLPEGLERIGYDAFWDCNFIYELIIPHSVTKISKRAFRECRNLAVVQMLSPIEKIESYTFEDCKSLSAVNIPEGVKAISRDAFKGCSNLKNVYLPPSVTNIEKYAFSDYPFSKSE